MDLELGGISEATGRISESGRFLWRHLAFRRKQMCSSSSWVVKEMDATEGKMWSVGHCGPADPPISEPSA